MLVQGGFVLIALPLGFLLCSLMHKASAASLFKLIGKSSRNLRKNTVTVNEILQRARNKSISLVSRM